jgi:hypothetical protein
MSTAGTADAVTYNYCNITVKYEHTGKSDTVVVKYAFPEPSSFTSRFYVAGGAGYSLSSDATEGLEYGAVVAQLTQGTMLSTIAMMRLSSMAMARLIGTPPTCSAIKRLVR